MFDLHHIAQRYYPPLFFILVTCHAVSDVPHAIQDPLQRFGIGQPSAVNVLPKQNLVAVHAAGIHLFNPEVRDFVAHHWTGPGVFSPDGSMLAIDAPGGLQIIDVQSGNLVKSIEGEFFLPFSFTGSNTSLAVVGFGNEAYRTYILDLETESSTQVFGSGWQNPITALSCSEGGTLIAEAVKNGPINIWRVGDGSLVRRIPSVTRDVDSQLQFLYGDSDFLFSDLEIVYRIDIETGETKNTYPTQGNALSLSPDESRILLYNELRDVETGDLIHTYPFYIAGTNAFLAGGSEAVMMADPENLCIIDMESGEQLLSRELDYAQSAVWVSEDKILTGGTENIALWSVEKGENLLRTRMHSMGWPLYDVAYYPKEYAIAGMRNYSIDFFSVVTGEYLRSFDNAYGYDQGIISTMGTFFLSGDGYIDRVDIDTGEIQKRILTPDPFYEVSISESGHLGATWLWSDQCLIVYDLNTGDEIRRLNGSYFHSACFNPEETLMAFGDSAIRVLNITNGDIFTLVEYEGLSGIDAITWSPNGKYIAASISKGSHYTAVYESETGREVRRFKGSSQKIVFSPGSNHILTQRGSMAYLWSVDSPLSKITVSAPDLFAIENTNNIGMLRISRSSPLDEELVVHFRWGGTAVKGVDFASFRTPVTIPAGQDYLEIPITPKPDDLPEGDETITLTLAANAAYTIATPQTATITLHDDDAPSTQANGWEQYR